jgi:hypothetical protein
MLEFQGFEIFVHRFFVRVVGLSLGESLALGYHTLEYVTGYLYRFCCVSCVTSYFMESRKVRVCHVFAILHVGRR